MTETTGREGGHKEAQGERRWVNHAGGCGLKGKVLASNVIEAVEQIAMGTVKVKSVDPKAKDELFLSKVYLM